MLLFFLICKSYSTMSFVCIHGVVIQNFIFVCLFFFIHALSLLMNDL